MTATTMGGAPANSATNASSGTNPAQSTSSQTLQSLVEQLANASKNTSSFASILQGTPLESLAGPITAISQTLDTAGTIISGVATAIEENKDNGVVSQVLGVAESLLGNASAFSGGGATAQSGGGATAQGDGGATAQGDGGATAQGDGGASGEAEGGSEGKTSFVDTLRKKVGQLKEIWDEYYQDLFTQEGKLNTERAKQMAMAVGDVILGSKKMAKVRKAFAVGEVIRDTAVAIMKAAASKPFPANLIPIAKATATGAASLATVKGQAHDGLDRIPSTGTYLLEKGERVVGSSLNRDLSDFLRFQQSSVVQAGMATNSSGSGAGSQTINQSPSVNLTINGDPDPDAVRSNRGALESMIREIYADNALASPFD